MKINWAEAKLRLGPLSDEEQRVVAMLAESATHAEIGKVLGQHRSMVWRKIQKIKAKLA